jgi:hypothetical protein
MAVFNDICFPKFPQASSRRSLAMPQEPLSVDASTLDIKSVLKELEVPFSPSQVQWRVTNTAKDRKRGQVVPYADPRAYADRLNALFTPQGWTREYCVETVSNITRIKGGESIVSGKILVTCTVTIIGLWSHSGAGEEWADDSNAMTAADAQAFKHACSCFGLVRYLYEFHGSWIDLDQNLQPKQMPALAGWAIPENWRNGIHSGNQRKRPPRAGKWLQWERPQWAEVERTEARPGEQFGR